MPETTRIGWIGTGVMGLSMCGHLQAKGHPVTIYSRTKSRSQSLLDKGAAWADTPAGVTDRSDVVFTIVGLPSDVRSVYLEKNGILSAAKPGTITVDMPGRGGRIHDVPFARCEIADSFDVVADLTFHNHPPLRRTNVKVTFVVRIVRRKILFVAPDRLGPHGLKVQPVPAIAVDYSFVR